MAEAGDPRADSGTPSYRRALIALFCAGLAVFAQMYSPQGLLPEISREYGVDAGTSSWAVGSTTIGVAFGVIPWARVSDRIGRIAAMRVAMVAAALIGLIAPFTPGFGAFAAVRLLEGVALAGLPSIAVTALAETVRPRALGTAVGTYIAGTTIGGLSGRIVAAEIGERLGWQWGVFGVAVLAAAATAVFVVLIPSTAVPPSPPLPAARAIIANLRTPGVLVLIAQGFLLMGGFVATYNYLAFRLQHAPFGLSLAQTSWIFLAYLAGSLTSRYVWRWTRGVLPSVVLLLSVGAMLLGISLTLTSWLWTVIVGLVLFTGAFFAAHSIASGLIERRAREGKSLAPPLYNLGYYTGSSLLGWCGGLAYAAGGWAGTAAMVAASTLSVGILALLYARSQGGFAAADRVRT